MIILCTEISWSIYQCKIAFSNIAFCYYSSLRKECNFTPWVSKFPPPLFYYYYLQWKAEWTNKIIDDWDTKFCIKNIYVSKLVEKKVFFFLITWNKNIKTGRFRLRPEERKISQKKGRLGRYALSIH